MLECVAFYDCIAFFSSIAFFLSDLGEIAKQEDLGNQIYLTGKQLKSSAADQPLAEGLKKEEGETLKYLHTFEKCHILDLSDFSGFEK